jgi:hypothetical protein
MRVARTVLFLAVLPSVFGANGFDGGFESGNLSTWRVLGDASIVGTIYDTAAPEGKLQARLQASPSVTVQQAINFAQIDLSQLRVQFPDSTRVSMIQEPIDGAVSVTVRLKGFTNTATNPSTNVFVIYRTDPARAAGGVPITTVNNLGPIAAPGAGGFAFPSPMYFNLPVLNTLSPGTLTIAIFEPSGNPQDSALLVDDISVVGASSLTRAGVLAQVASGGGWKTRIMISNTDTVPVPISVRFWDEQGAPYRLILSFPQPNHGPNTIESEVNRTLQVHESLIVDWQQPTASPQVGWAEILSDGRVGSFATFHYQQSADSAVEATIPMVMPNQDSLLIPFDHTSDHGTAVAIVNGTSLNASSLSATVYDDSGKVILQQPNLTTIPTNGHVAFSLAALLNATVGIRGMVEVHSSAGPIGAAVLSFGPSNTLTSTPAF